MFKFVTDPIDFQKEYDAIRKPEYGCILFFLGVSRNAPEDASVKALEYFAYDEMAIKKAKELENKIVQKYQMGELDIVHRLGIVRVSELSLLVIIGSGHRKQMFEALEETVDLIKKEIPIWKKAIFENGETKWLENQF
jgi:molybdopterin synthase catalytic subunit